MKKMLSLILCLATIFSSVAFCFPAIAADLDYDVETGADYATLPAEEQEDQAALAEDLVLPLVFDFEDGVIPDSVSLKNKLGGAELSVVDKGDGKAMQVLVPEDTAWIAGRVVFAVTSDALPAGRYRISADFAADTYPEDGYVLYVYYGTNNDKGKLTSYSIFEKGATVTEDGTVTAEVEFDEAKTPFDIQYALFKNPQEPFTATYTLDNVKLEEIPMPATVVFDANGGSGTQASIQTETGATVTLPETTTFTRDYYDFVGWGLTSDAAANDAVSSYTVVLSELSSAKTKTFYALWKPVSVPSFDGSVSLRLAKPAGFRMRASLAQRVLTMDDNVEVGVMVTLDKNISGDFTYESGKAENYPILMGIGYSKVDGKEKINKLTVDANVDSTANLTVIITGIPDTVVGYTSALAFRPYVTIGSCRYYGDTRTISAAEVAARLKKHPDYSKNDYVNHILNMAETNSTRPEKYLIVTPDPNEDDTYITSAFNPTSGMHAIYVHAWVDGSTKWIEVNKDAKIWPNIKTDIDEYVNKVATYTVDSDGRYTVKLLGNAYDDKKMDEDSYIGLTHDATVLEDEEDSSITCLFERGNGKYDGWLKKIADRCYRMPDMNIGLLLNHDSRILIRNEYVDENGEKVVKFVEYSANTLPVLIENQLTNVQAVVSNNVNYTDKENLVFYFAEALGEELQDTSAEPEEPEEPESPETLPEDLSNILIVTPDPNEDDTYITSVFNPTSGMRTIYVHAWVDGSTKWVEVNKDAKIWPNIKTDIDEYVNKVATYTVDSDGRYTVKLLGNAYDDKKMDENSYIGLNKDETGLDDNADNTIRYLYEGIGYEHLTKQFGKRFKSIGGCFNRTFVVDKNSIILIRNEYMDGEDKVVDFVPYTADTLTETIENDLTNVQIVVSNNPDSTRENLVLYFAEAIGEELSLDYKTPSNPKRIVKDSELKKDASGKCSYEYTLYNPYTGETETMCGNKNNYGIRDSSPYTYGDVVDITESTSGLAVNDKRNASSGSLLHYKDLYWILDYDAEGGMIEVVHLPTNEAETDAVENGIVVTYILSVQNTFVTQIGNQDMSGSDIIRWGPFTKAAVNDLGSITNKFKAVNSSYKRKDTSDPITVYAKHLKAYLFIDWTDEQDHMCIDENGCNGTISFASVVINDGEPLYRCKLS